MASGAWTLMPNSLRGTVVEQAVAGTVIWGNLSISLAVYPNASSPRIVYSSLGLPDARSAYTLCPANTFSPQAGAACVQCQNATAAAASNFCFCNPGYFGRHSAEEACLPCLAGKFSTTEGATAVNTCTPCPDGSSSSAGSSACLQPYQIAHTPPENHQDSEFSGVLVEGGEDWYAPDRQGSQYAGGGDPSFYFVLDLGTSRTVAKLVIRNTWQSGDYTTKFFSISMSIDSSTDNFGPQVTGTLAGQDTSLQEVPVGLTGRYLKFQVLTYGPYSAGLEYVAVLVSA